MENNQPFKRLCHLSTHGYFDPVPRLGRTDTGGQVTYVLELAKAFARMGIKVDIYTRWFNRSKKQIDPVPGCPGVRVVRIPAGPWEFIPKEEIYSVLPELAKNMVEFICENKFSYDLFHGHYVDAGIVTLEVAKAFKKPDFFTAHSLGAWKQEQMGGDPQVMEKKYRFKYRIAEELRIFKTVTAQTLTTPLQREKLKQLCGFQADNIEIIPPGVDIKKFRPSRQEEGEQKIVLPRKYVFCLSRIDTNKGHDLLLNAFDIVSKEIDDVYLVIGGGSPNPKERELKLLESIDGLIKKKKMQDRVEVVGYVPDEDLAAYYRQAQLFALPSLFEPFGMTALEAMVCGQTVVASKYGGIQNVITSGKDGFLVDPRNAGEFADAIIKVLKDRQLAERIGKEAYKTAYENFSWDAIAGKHVEFYKKYTK